MYKKEGGQNLGQTGVREMARRVKVLTALAEDLGLTPGTLHGGSQLPVLPVSGDPTYLLTSGLLNTYGSHKFIQTHIHTHE